MSAITPRQITDALNGRLTAAAITTEIAWPNRVYVPKKGVPYLNVESAGRTRTPLGAGRDSVVQWSGIYQVGVNFPRDTGDRDQENMANKVLLAFDRGLSLPLNGGNFLIVEYSTCPQPVVFGDWSTLPCQTFWFATAAP